MWHGAQPRENVSAMSRAEFLMLMFFQNLNMLFRQTEFNTKTCKRHGGPLTLILAE